MGRGLWAGLRGRGRGHGAGPTVCGRGQGDVGGAGGRAEGVWEGPRGGAEGPWEGLAAGGRVLTAGRDWLQEGQAGLNFADQGEAAAFEGRVQERLLRRQQRAGERGPQCPGAAQRAPG